MVLNAIRTKNFLLLFRTMLPTHWNENLRAIMGNLIKEKYSKKNKIKEEEKERKWHMTEADIIVREEVESKCKYIIIM